MLLKCPICGRRRQIGAPGKGPLARALFAKRTELRLTLEQVAEKLSLDISTYHRAEQGRVPKLSAALKLARWLGRPIEEFFP